MILLYVSALALCHCCSYPCEMVVCRHHNFVFYEAARPASRKKKLLSIALFKASNLKRTALAVNLHEILGKFPRFPWIPDFHGFAKIPLGLLRFPRIPLNFIGFLKCFRDFLRFPQFSWVSYGFLGSEETQGLLIKLSLS